MPLALATCLIPDHFSEHNLVTFMTSLLPAMLDMYCGSSGSDSESDSKLCFLLDEQQQQQQAELQLLTPQIRQHCLQTAPRIVTTEPIETLLASIRENQAL
jgi:hypothetical protein